MLAGICFGRYAGNPSLITLQDIKWPVHISCAPATRMSSSFWALKGDLLAARDELAIQAA